MSVVDVWSIVIDRKADGEARMRELLGGRLGIPALEVPLTRRPGGKPILDPGAGLRDLRCNLSHSHERAVIAIAEGVEVGVDLERVTPRRPLGYGRDWCRREAYLKGIGAGLRGGPRSLSFEATSESGRWSVLREDAPVPGWTVIDLDAGKGYVAALAVGSEVDVSVRLDPSIDDGG